MLERHRVPEDVHLRVGFRLGVHPLLRQLLDFERHHVRRRLRAARDALEVLLRLRLGLVRLEVAHENERDVLRRIIDRVELVGLRLGDRRDVRRPAHDRPGVGRGFPEHRVELLLELAQRRRIRPHPPLLEHHVALGIELAEDRVQDAVRLHPHPQLQLVGRHGDEVGGHVLGREGVHARAARPAVDPVELVLDQDVALLGNELVELLFQLAIARRSCFRASAGRQFPRGDTPRASSAPPGASHRARVPARR